MLETTPKESGSAILIVAAEAAVRSVTQRLLAQCGFETLAAADAREALALLAKSGARIAGAVLDLSVPGRLAEATFHALRDAQPELPILFTGGRGEASISAQLIDATHTAFLPKPFGLDALGAKAGALFAAV